MIELGKMQTLVVKQKTERAYLLCEKEEPGIEVILPQTLISYDMDTWDTIEVFVYKNGDNFVSTTHKPQISVGELAPLKVAEVTNIGAFLEWGVDKDLFMPFKEQVGAIEVGGTYLVRMYVDKSNRLSASMHISSLLQTQSPYKVNDRVQGTVYGINPQIGVFVAVDNLFMGLIAQRELFTEFKLGDRVEVRVKKVREDGKLELSLREQAYKEIESDAKKILDRLKESNGKILFNDKSHPEMIKQELGMSKGAFKRAVGLLLKEGAIIITEDGIVMAW